MRRERRSAGSTGFAIDFPDDVEQMRVHLGRLVEPPIPAEPVQFIEHRLVIDAVDHKGERTGFVGVLVREDDGPRVAVGDRRLGRVRNEPAAVNAAATASCAAAPPRPTHLLRFKPANNPSFPNTSRPAAKPADCAYDSYTYAFAGSPADLPRPPERLSLALLVRIVTLASQLRQKAIYWAYSSIWPPFQS